MKESLYLIGAEELQEIISTSLNVPQTVELSLIPVGRLQTAEATGPVPSN